MDPICHTLLGASLAQTGLGQRTTYATAALLIGANLPDIDAFASGVGSDAALCFRRGWTHGILAQATLPLLLAGALILWYRLRRPPDRPPPMAGQLILVSYIGLLTHPLLDWLNNYGVRLLMPFEGRWFYGDALYIIDPWMWLLLASAAFLGYSKRRSALAAWAALALMTSAMVLPAAPADLPLVKIVWIAWLAALALLRSRGAGQTDPSRSRIARTMLALTALYIVLMLGITHYGRFKVRRFCEREGIVVERMMVGPLPANPFVRDVVIATPDGYRYGDFALLPAYKLELSPRTIPKPPDSLPVLEAITAPELHGLMNWIRFPFVEVEEGERTYTVRITDARYDRNIGQGFGSAVVQVPRTDQ